MARTAKNGRAAVRASSAKRRQGTKPVRPAPRARPAVPFFTVGYEGRAQGEYLALLSDAGVTLLCDVRSNPFSRKPGFSRRALAEGCEQAGIRYEHLPELGIPKEKRRNVAEREDYEALFTEYERTTLSAERASVARIAAWARSGERVALTCYERLPEHCHRNRLAKALERLEPRKGRGRLVAKHL